jgi:dimethylglycine dehydrogenase
MGALFGLNCGWEHPLWFAQDGEPREETLGFKRQNWWGPVGREARMLREHAGIIDISNFAKYAVTGDGAETWLNALFANRMPTEVGRSCLTPLIGKRGGIAGDFTVTKLGDGDFMIFGSGMAERFHQRFFKAVPLPANTTFGSRTDSMCAFNVAGPKSRELLSRLTNEDLSNEAFPFMRSRRMVVAGVDVVALRVSFTGDLGWELHCDAGKQLELYDALLSTGKELGAGPVGARALMSLRVEKGYGSWSREYSPEYWPQESGLDRLIKLEKGDFLNRDAYLKIAANVPRQRLAMVSIDSVDADATGGEPIFLPDGTPIGQVSSGAYGYSVGMSLALCYIKAGTAKPGDKVSVAVLGRPREAVILDKPPFDAEGARLRA